MPWALLTNKWVLGGLLIALMAGAIGIQTLRLNAASKERDAAVLTSKQWQANYEAAEQTNRENVQALEKLRAENAKADQAAAEQIAKYNRLGLAYSKLLKAAQNDTTPLSDSWRAVFDSLRSIDTSAPNNN